MQKLARNGILAVTTAQSTALFTNGSYITKPCFCFIRHDHPNYSTNALLSKRQPSRKIAETAAILVHFVKPILVNP